MDASKLFEKHSERLAGARCYSGIVSGVRRESCVSGRDWSQRSSGRVYSKLLSGWQCVPLCLRLCRENGGRGGTHLCKQRSQKAIKTHAVHLIPCDRYSVRGEEGTECFMQDSSAGWWR